MLFVLPCCSTLCRWSVTKSCATCYTKRHARKNGPQSYIYIMQVIRSLSFSGIETIVFRLPITGIMYSGLRQIAALPTRLDPEPKPQKNKAKVCKLRTRPARSKKARPRQVPLKFLIWFNFNGKNFTGSLAFFPRLHVRESFLFFRFFLCGNGSDKTLYYGLTLA